MSDVLSPDFSTTPFWTRNLPVFSASNGPLPKSVDVIVVGGGYAGLSAARTLAAAGRSVIVFEADQFGEGASSRSAGSLGHVPKAKLPDLISGYGENTARRLFEEARMAREFVEGLIATLGISCELETNGRFVAAHSEKAFARLRASFEAFKQSWGDIALVSPAEQRSEIGSDSFHGGIRISSSATVQPALLHRGLADAALRAGAYLRERTRVRDIRRASGVFEVDAGGETYTATEILIATNAETGRDTAEMRRLRRGLTIVPAFALVTEEMPISSLHGVLPNRRSFSDTFKILHYMAPVGQNRLVMSGRAGRSDGDLRQKAERIFSYFRSRFPDLSNVRVSHCWTGRFALTQDWIPHVGQEEGVHYVLGCCGVGVPMSTYLGHKVALKILGSEDGDTAYDRPLPMIPYWPANNIFLPLAVRALGLRDRLFN